MAEADTQWPPKSPRDVWLSSPTRKKRYQSTSRTDISPSASPLRKALFTGRSAYHGQLGTDRSAHKVLSRSDRGDEENGDGDGDEDEETLELKLKAIETRLKLKKLRQAKDSPASSIVGDVSNKSRDEGWNGSGNRNGLFRSEMQVPLSPTKKIHVPARPSGKVERLERRSSPVRDTNPVMHPIHYSQPNKTLRYQNSPIPAVSSMCSRTQASASSRAYSSDTPAKSFSERIAEGRLSAKEKLEKETRLSKSRSSGFHSSLRSERNGSVSSSDTICTNRSQHASASGIKPTSSAFRRGSSPAKSRLNYSSQHTQESELSQRSANRNSPSKPSREMGDEPAMFEPYSGFHLSRRWSDHDTLTRLLENKELYSIPKLLKVVKSPNYDPPDTESDYVIFGTVAWKSSPLDHKGNQQQQQKEKPQETNRRLKSKFMVIKLTDLKWELDLFLFDTGFEQFWKMSLGTVVAILNPGIFPPKNSDTGRFSLKLSSSEDTVIEIGSARDLGFCKSVKKDGQECNAWIDRRRTEFCDFHVSLQLEKSRAGRMEVNGSSTFASSGSRQRYKKSQDDGLLREGRQHNSQLHETYYLTPSQFGLVKNTTALIDGDDEPGVTNTERGRSKRELNRKRVLEKSKERELARKLGDVGNGIGSEYLRSRQNKNEGTDNNMKSSEDFGIFTDAKVDAESLGLLKTKITETQLCKQKRRRLNTTDEPAGWSMAFKSGLPQGKGPREEQGHISPSKKKARFILARGIREPGRESLGNAISENNGSNDDDLEII